MHLRNRILTILLIAPHAGESFITVRSQDMPFGQKQLKTWKAHALVACQQPDASSCQYVIFEGHN